MEHQKLEYPQLVLLGTNTICNYKCIFCNNPKMEKNDLTLIDFLTPDIEKLIEKSQTVDISGYGEIVLSPHFKIMVELLNKYKRKFSMSSNGFALIPEILDYLNNSSLYYITVSLNSLNHSTYKKLMGVDGLDRVLANLDYLCNKIKRNFHLNISMVLNELVIDEVEDFVRYVYQNKANSLRLTPLTNSIKDYPTEIGIVDHQKYISLLSKSKKLAQELGVQISIPNLNSNRSDIEDKIRKCTIPWKVVGVDANMNVTPCCNLGRMYMGNLRGGKEKFEDIWNGEKYWELRNSITDGSIKYCKHCVEFG
jgi:MoaA/NifB/PqqE/SkfB family radical SAM enzyme